MTLLDAGLLIAVEGQRMDQSPGSVKVLSCDVEGRVGNETFGDYWRLGLVHPLRARREVDVQYLAGISLRSNLRLSECILWHRTRQRICDWRDRHGRRVYATGFRLIFTGTLLGRAFTPGCYVCNNRGSTNSACSLLSSTRRD